MELLGAVFLLFVCLVLSASCVVMSGAINLLGGSKSDKITVALCWITCVFLWCVLFTSVEITIN